MNSGDIVRVTDPLANATQYAYDARHNVTEMTDPRGHRSTFQYNSRNKVTQMVRAAGTRRDAEPDDEPDLGRQRRYHQRQFDERDQSPRYPN